MPQAPAPVAAPAPSRPRTLARHALGAVLVLAGVSHLTFAREEFQAQVPPWVPVDEDTTVLASGVAEITLGLALITQRERQRTVGAVAAAFFVAIFPGNVAQYTHGRDGFGLDTDRKRALRLLGQPVLVGWAWWATRNR